MTISNISKTDYLIIFLFLLGIFGFFWYKCSCNPLPQQKLAVDSSVILKYKSDTARLHANIETANKERAYYEGKADSLQQIVNMDEARLGTRAVTINDLVAQVKRFKATADTAALLNIIDSLTDEVEQGIAAVWDYEQQNHRLDSALRSVIASDSLIKSTLHEENVACNNFAFVLQLDVTRLRSDSAILAGKLIKSKKYSKISTLVNAALAAALFLTLKK